jgi:HemY protein
MIRAIYLFLIIAILALAGVWLADNPGVVSVRWGGYVIETSMVFLAGAALIVALFLSILFSTYRWMRTRPGSWGGAFASRRRGRGLDALSNGMVAIAAGDADEARRAAIEAEKYLKDEPMTLLLAAQAAELNQDDRAAKIYYDRMADRADTEFLGLRGLIERARADGDLAQTLIHLRRADDLKPGTEWVLKGLMEILLKQRNYEDAEAVLDRMGRGKSAKQEGVRHLQAVIGYERARLAKREGKTEATLSLAEAAHSADPKFVPAAALLVQSMGSGRKRDKVISNAWRLNPHPELKVAIKDLVLAEGAQEWLARAKAIMLPSAPDHRETKIALARAAFDARQFGEARKYLDDLSKNNPSVTVYRMLAELEEIANADAAAARNWIIKSTEAPHDPIWACNSCGAQASGWNAHCPTCDTFDSQSWRSVTPPREEDGILEAIVVEEIPAQ